MLPAEQQVGIYMDVFADGFNFPEGPAFDREGNLFAVNVLGDEVFRISPSGEKSVFARTGGTTNGLAFHANGDLYVADWGRRAILCITPDAQVSVFADRYAGVRLRAPNDLTFDLQGNLYFTDPIRYPFPDHNISPVFKVDPWGDVTLVGSEFSEPNGIALSPDGSWLYVSQTRANSIARIAIGRDDSFGAPEELVHLGENAWPDGMCIDSEGNIVQALYGQGKLAVVSPQGAVLELYDTGSPHCTNVCFGGSDFRTLYATCPTIDAIVCIRHPDAGLPLFSHAPLTPRRQGA